LAGPRGDVPAVEPDRRAPGHLELPGLVLADHDDRFDGSIDPFMGDGLTEARDRERTVLSARAHEDGGDPLARRSRGRLRALRGAAAHSEHDDRQACHDDCGKPPPPRTHERASLPECDEELTLRPASDTAPDTDRAGEAERRPFQPHATERAGSARIAGRRLDALPGVAHGHVVRDPVAGGEDSAGRPRRLEDVALHVLGVRHAGNQGHGRAQHEVAGVRVVLVRARLEGQRLVREQHPPDEPVPGDAPPGACPADAGGPGSLVYSIATPVQPFSCCRCSSWPAQNHCSSGMLLPSRQ